MSFGSWLVRETPVVSGCWPSKPVDKARTEYVRFLWLPVATLVQETSQIDWTAVYRRETTFSNIHYSQHPVQKLRSRQSCCETARIWQIIHIMMCKGMTEQWIICTEKILLFSESFTLDVADTLPRR